MTKDQFIQLLDVYADALLRHRGNVNKIANARNAVIVAAGYSDEPSASMLLAEVERIRLLLIADGWTPPEGKSQ